MSLRTEIIPWNCTVCGGSHTYILNLEAEGRCKKSGGRGLTRQAQGSSPQLETVHPLNNELKPMALEAPLAVWLVLGLEPKQVAPGFGRSYLL